MLKIKNTEVTFEKIFKEDYIPKEYEDEIKHSNILLIPSKTFRDKNILYFPEGTKDFFQYIKEREDGKTNIEISISDEKFNELELHSDIVRIATIIIKDFILSVAINLISDYLKNKLKKENKSSKKVEVELNMIIQKKNKSLEINYRGSVKDFEKIDKSKILKEFNKNED